MFGFTSSGCFIIGVIFGFILAAILAVGAVFFFNTDLRREGITYVESFWSKVKNSVDDSIDAAKKTPAPCRSPKNGTDSADPQSAAEPDVTFPQQKEDKTRKPGITINIGMNSESRCRNSFV